MKRVLCVVLALFITLGCAFCLAAKAQTDPFGPQAETQIRDTGRGYIAYSFYSSAVYYSADGAAWTDLSDRAWVRDAASYIYSGVGPHGHREFDLLWTGSEYMLRQSLRDDPRGAYTHQGDNPRNRVVTFLDEDFQVIGEKAFDGPVTAIRCGDGAYYATVGGVEAAFTRADWTTSFRDVPADSWYAPYADVCVEEGLMQGVGNGLFAPERTLTGPECSVLALRLYDRNHGGDGTFAPAPAGFGQITLTLADGSTLSGAIGDGCAVKGTSLAAETWAWGLFADRDAGRPYSQHLYIDIDTPEELAWLEQIGGRGWPDAVATYDGVKYPGEMRFFSLDEERGGFYFHPDDYEGFLAATEHVRPFAADADAWYRDAWYYAYTHRTEDSADSEYYLMEGLVHSNDATRWDFASRLAQVAGELPAINAIETIPDLDGWQENDLLPLYNAGILTGVDDYGTFYPEGTLTRAECAAMLARVLRPELRVTFTISPPPQDSATQD